MGGEGEEGQKRMREGGLEEEGRGGREERVRR